MSFTETTGMASGEQGTREKAQDVAETVADEGRGLADTTRGEAANVAIEAREQVRTLFSEATTQIEEQSRSQQQRLAGTARTFSDDLSGMAAERSGLASDLARELADRARSLATQLEDREPRDLVQGVREFARQRPGTFLFGALATGVIAGRLTRATQAVTQQDDNDAPASTSEPGWVDNHAGDTDFSPAAASDLGTATFPTAPAESASPVNPGNRL
jgi:hypothetical protein